jgi:hypothetical protein
MMTIIARLRAWCRHPEKRLADDKRRLEAVLREHGISVAQRKRIVFEYFTDEARE